jgi:hypothetical protein
MNWSVNLVHHDFEYNPNITSSHIQPMKEHQNMNIKFIN